ncbi:MAG: HPr family phosphocarrier protein [Gemmataceae bacterium]|nr:HPr family phosphocarrier protein [Gemmataceae bacterium]
MSQEPLRRTVTIASPHGLHLRPIQAFVELANKFQSDVTVSNAKERVNGKSGFGLMTLAAEQGSQLTLEVSGPDASEAIEALAAVLARVFPDE